MKQNHDLFKEGLTFVSLVRNYSSPIFSFLQKNADELMNILGLGETVENLAKACRVRWYGHVLRDEDLTKALSFKVAGQRKWERPRKIWRRQVEEKISCQHRLTGSEPDENWTATTGSDIGMAKAHTFL